MPNLYHRLSTGLLSVFAVLVVFSQTNEVQGFDLMVAPLSPVSINDSYSDTLSSSLSIMQSSDTLSVTIFLDWLLPVSSDFHIRLTNGDSTVIVLDEFIIMGNEDLVYPIQSMEFYENSSVINILLPSVQNILLMNVGVLTEDSEVSWSEAFELSF